MRGLELCAKEIGDEFKKTLRTCGRAPLLDCQKVMPLPVPVTGRTGTYGTVKKYAVTGRSGTYGTVKKYAITGNRLTVPVH